MAQGRSVRISNSSLNCYGTRVMTEGVDLSQFKRNPLLLWMHLRPYSSLKNTILPLGVVSNIRVEGDDIIGDLVFDEGDDFAKEIARKWDAGILKMVSPNFDIIAVDESAELTLPGQTRATVTKAKLIEVSVVDIGGNDANMVLSYAGTELKLSESGDIPQIPLLPIYNTKKNKNMDLREEMALKMGLPKDATVEQITTEIAGLKSRETEVLELRAKLENLELAAITAAVDAGITANKFTADKRDHFIELGKKVGADALKLTIDSMASGIKPTDIIHSNASMQLGGGGSEYKKLSEVPADKLLELRKNDRETYMRLFKAEYGFDCPKY